MNTSIRSLVGQLSVTGSYRLGFVFLVSLMAACSSAPKSEVVVSVKDQTLGLYEKGHLKKQFTISTSKFGLGDKPGSCRTPLGKHEIIAKIGHGLPAGAVLKSRSWNGEVLKPNAPGRDPIVSRILWLRGMESGNRNAMNRYIYIHGTPEENRLGHPASYGCIRMGIKDVVEVFNEVNIGAKVIVTRGALPQGHKGGAQPTPEAETVIADKKTAPGSAESSVPNAIPVAPAKTDAATAQTDALKKADPKSPNTKPTGKAHSESKPVARTKSKKTAAKPEKITTSNRRHVSTERAHG